MKTIIAILTLFLLVGSINAQSLYFPPANDTSWETLSPDSLGYCTDQIDVLYEFLEQEQTNSFLLLKDGKIVLEKYFGTFTQDSVWFWFSAGKSLRAFLVGIAQEEGLLDIQDKTSDYLGTGWTNLDPEKEESITIWHQLTMTSGLNEDSFACVDPICLTFKADAGTRWVYHNSPYNLLKNVLEEAAGSTINAYTNQKVRSKIGMQTGFWLASGDNTFFISRARDMARFGILIQNRGYWDNEPLLTDTTYFNQMVNTSQSLNQSYGYLWWLNGKESFIPSNFPITIPGSISPDAPSDVILAAGAQGQLISIAPNEGLIMIRQGRSGSNDLAPVGLHNEIWKRIIELNCNITSTQSEFGNAIQVYPNPATDIIQIKGLQNNSYSIELFNAQGQSINQVQNQRSMDIQNLPEGLYLMKIKREGQFILKKVIIKR